MDQESIGFAVSENQGKISIIEKVSYGLGDLASNLVFSLDSYNIGCNDSQFK